MSLSSFPQHGELIAVDDIATRQFSQYLTDLADLYSLNSKPDEAEIIFKNGKAELNLNTFMQEIADAVGITPPEEGEVILIDNMASFRFQTFLDDIAG
jgi:hypothetical protein